MLQITKSNHIPVQLQTPILAISTYGYIKSSSNKDNNKSGLGLGIFIGKTLLERNKAKVVCRNSKTRLGAEVIISWKNTFLKDFILRFFQILVLLGRQVGRSPLNFESDVRFASNPKTQQ